MIGDEEVEVVSVELFDTDSTTAVGRSEDREEEELALGSWVARDRFSFTRHLPSSFPSSSPLVWMISWHRPSSSSSSAAIQTTLIPTSIALTSTLHHPLPLPSSVSK